VLVDDRQVATSPASDSGEITFNVPTGPHNVSVELRPTPIRQMVLLYIPRHRCFDDSPPHVRAFHPPQIASKPIDKASPIAIKKHGSRAGRYAVV